MDSKTADQGFTLVELMVVVAIIAIIASIGTTALLSYLPQMRLKSAARDVFSTMSQAKMEAIKRGQNVTILFASPANGYTMFLDSDNDETVDAGETVLYTAPQFPNQVQFDPTLTVDGNLINDGISFVNNALIFSPRGIPIGAAGGFGGGTIGLRAIDGKGNTLRQRTVVVSTAGRINMN